MKLALRPKKLFDALVCRGVIGAVLGTLALCIAAALAGDAGNDVPGLVPAREVYQTQLAAIEDEIAGTLTELDQRYASMLEQLAENLRADGDLQELLDIHDEVNRFNKDPTSLVEDVSTLPVPVRNLWESLVARREIVAEQEIALKRVLNQRYLNHLQNICADLTRENRMADALLVDAEIMEVRQELARLTPEPEVPEREPSGAAMPRQVPETRVADSRSTDEPEDQPPAVTMRARRLSSTRDVDVRWQTHWGSYARDLSSRIAVDIELFNLRNVPVSLKLETFFVARPSSGADRWIFDRHTESLTLDQNFNTVVISKPLSASVSFYQFSRTRRTTGDRIEGYIVRLLHGRDVVSVEASSHPLKRIGEDSATLDAIMPR